MNLNDSLRLFLILSWSTTPKKRIPSVLISSFIIPHTGANTWIIALVLRDQWAPQTAEKTTSSVNLSALWNFVTKLSTLCNLLCAQPWRQDTRRESSHQTSSPRDNRLDVLRPSQLSWPGCVSTRNKRWSQMQMIYHQESATTSWTLPTWSHPLIAESRARA